MAEITLKADVGRPTGTRVSKRLRAVGRVPGVVYGLGHDPVAVDVDWRDLRVALTGDAGLNALIDLEFDGQSQLSIVKSLQRHPVHHTVTHVDFLLITYQPGGTSSSSGLLMRHSGAEFGYVVSGELTLTLGFDTHRLRAGDAVSFDSSTPHAYRNETSEPAVGVWFVLERSA